MSRNYPLHAAAKSGDVNKVRKILGGGEYDVNCKDSKGNTPLHRACAGGHVGVVRELVKKHNADINARDDNNNTPLHVAALAGKDEVALALITELNCDVTVKGSIGRSLLHIACNGGNVNLARTLVLKHEADLTAKDDTNNTPLHVAALCGRNEVALALITEFSCDVAVKGYIGRSLLHFACQQGSISLVRALVLKHRADLTARDDNNNTPLHVAALCGKDKVALALITEFNCDVEVRGHQGRTVLHMACASGNVHLVQSLAVKHGADVTARDNKNRTPLHLAEEKNRDEVVSLLKSSATAPTPTSRSAFRDDITTISLEPSSSNIKALTVDFRARQVNNLDSFVQDKGPQMYQFSDPDVATSTTNPTTAKNLTLDGIDVLVQGPPASSTQAQGVAIQSTEQTSGEHSGDEENMDIAVETIPAKDNKRQLPKPFTSSMQHGSEVSQERPISTIRDVYMSIGRWVISIPRPLYQFCVLHFTSFSFSVWRLGGSFIRYTVFVYYVH